MLDAAQEYADSRGVYLYDQTPRELRIRERLWICFWRGLVLALVIASFFCFFSTTLAVPASLFSIIVTVFAVSMLISFSGFNQISYNIGLILFFLVFSAYSFLNLRVLNSGFSAIVNLIIHAVDEVYLLGGVREYTELIPNRQLTTTTTLGLISAVAVLLLFMVMKSNKRRYAGMLIADFLAFGFFFLVRLDPQISWVAMLLGSQATFILLQNSLHIRTPFRKEGVTYRKSKKETLYSYVVQKNAGTMWKSLTLGGFLMLLIFLVLSPITGLFYYNSMPGEKTSARAALDRLISDLTLNGLAGLFSEYDSVGGVSSGQLGGISNVTMDFQTDLTVDFVPYTYDRIFLKQHTYEIYHQESRLNWAGSLTQTSRWIADGMEFAGRDIKNDLERLNKGTQERLLLDPSESLYYLTIDSRKRQTLESLRSRAESAYSAYRNGEVIDDPYSYQSDNWLTKPEMFPFSSEEGWSLDDPTDQLTEEEKAQLAQIPEEEKLLLKRMFWSYQVYPYRDPGASSYLNSLESDWDLIQLNGLDLNQRRMLADWFRESYRTNNASRTSDAVSAWMRITPVDGYDLSIPYQGNFESLAIRNPGSNGETMENSANSYLDRYQPYLIQMPESYRMTFESVVSYDDLRKRLEGGPEDLNPEYLLGRPAPLSANPENLLLLAEATGDLDVKSREDFEDLKQETLNYYSDYYLRETCTSVPEDLKEYLTETFAPMYGLDEAGEKVLTGKELGIANYGYNELIDSLKHIYRTQYMYTYSPGKTPKDREFIRYFLEFQKHGYCVYFASSAALILRSYGIPTRYCEGYAIDINEVIENGELLEEEKLEDWWVSGNNPFDNAGVITLDVTDSSAHAWVEVYYEGYGWSGRLTTLEPGQGYIYKSNATTIQTFSYPSAK